MISTSDIVKCSDQQTILSMTETFSLSTEEGVGLDTTK